MMAPSSSRVVGSTSSAWTFDLVPGDWPEGPSSIWETLRRPPSRHEHLWSVRACSEARPSGLPRPEPVATNARTAHPPSSAARSGVLEDRGEIEHRVGRLRVAPALRIHLQEEARAWARRRPPRGASAPSCCRRCSPRRRAGQRGRRGRSEARGARPGTAATTRVASASSPGSPGDEDGAPEVGERASRHPEQLRGDAAASRAGRRERARRAGCARTCSSIGRSVSGTRGVRNVGSSRGGSSSGESR